MQEIIWLLKLIDVIVAGIIVVTIRQLIKMLEKEK
jgi:hypothetical protein